MRIAVLGIDLGKNSRSVVGLDDDGRVVVRRRLRREDVLAFAAKLRRPARLPRRRAAGRTTSAGRWRREATRRA